MESLRALIFDFDGILADTEFLHYRTFAETLADVGITITQEENDTRYIGTSDQLAFQLAYQDAGRGTISPAESDRLIARKSQLYTQGTHEVELFPGVRELIRDASQRGVHVVIASCALRRDIEGVLRKHDLLQQFPEFVCGNDITRSKPDPECFLMALDLLREKGASDLRPEECVVFEDSVRGVEAAKRAEMRCVAVTNSFPAEQLSHADWVIASLGDWRWP